MSLDEILEEVDRFGCSLVELTGGEPLLQPASLPLMRRLCDQGHAVLLETGGGLDISSVDPRVHRILDVKCPGSGEVENNYWPNLEVLGERDEIKFVVADREDYEWARDLISARQLPQGCAIHFSPVQDELVAADLCSWILEDRLAVRLQLQIHKVVFGADARSV